MPTIDVKKEQRGVMAIQTTTNAARAKQYTGAGKSACSIDDLLNGGACEACQ